MVVLLFSGCSSLPLIELLGKHAEEDEDHQRPQQQLTDPGPHAQLRQGTHHLHNKNAQIHPQQRHIQLVHAISAVHEPCKSIADLAENSHNTGLLFRRGGAPVNFSLILLLFLTADNQFAPKFTNWSFICFVQRDILKPL